MILPVCCSIYLSVSAQDKPVNTGAHRVVSVVTNDISDDCNSVKLKQNDIYYKMAKAENVIALYFSTDSAKCFEKQAFVSFYRSIYQGKG